MEPLCVIVGAGPGIGLSVAFRFATEGFRVALIARSPDKLDDYVQKMAAMGFEAHGFVADAADFAAITQVFKQIHNTLGPSRVLVYNAAQLRKAKPSELTADDLIEDLRTNAAGALHAVHQVLPAMQQQKAGTILFTGGGFAIEPMPPYASLGAGKAALRNLTYSLHAELAPVNIHVATVTVCGFVEPGTKFDPDTIAETYWELYGQKPGARERERILD